MSLGSSLFGAAVRRGRRIFGTVLIAGALAAGACSGGYALPAPRPLVVRSGARLFADQARLAEIDVWVRRQQESIITDPTFWIVETRSSMETYPWQALSISSDTAVVQVYAAAPESGSVVSFYGPFPFDGLLGSARGSSTRGAGRRGVRARTDDSRSGVRRLVVRALGVRYRSLRHHSTNFCFRGKTGIWTPSSSRRAPKNSKRNAARGNGRIQDAKTSIADGSWRPSSGSPQASGRGSASERSLLGTGAWCRWGGEAVIAEVPTPSIWDRSPLRLRPAVPHGYPHDRSGEADRRRDVLRKPGTRAL